MTGPGPLLLLIASDPLQRRNLQLGLLGGGYRVCEADTGADGLTQARAHNPDLVLLGVGSIDGPGVAVVKRLRAWMRSPIVRTPERAGD